MISKGSLGLQILLGDPSFAMNDSVDSRLADAVASCDGSSAITSATDLANLVYLHLSQLCSSVLLSMLVVTAALTFHVMYVIGLRSHEEVVYVNTERDVAGMAHTHLSRVYSFEQEKREAMREPRTATHRDTPIAPRLIASKCCASPDDAFSMWASLVFEPRYGCLKRPSSVSSPSFLHVDNYRLYC